MWIRGQNKLTLQNVNRLVIEQFEIGIYIVGNGCTLGIYSTKEKALKVLENEPFMLSEHGGKNEVTELLEKSGVHPQK